MAINRVEIKDFLVFKGDFAVDFCPGVNVIIGGNATGKTTLLKVMYNQTLLHSKKDIVSETYCEGSSVDVQFGNEHYENSVFIPEKDILEHAKGLLTFIEQKQTGFSQIYKNVLVNAQDIPTQKQSETQQKIGKMITDIIGGTVHWDKGDGSFYTLKTDGNQIPLSDEASGFKKLGFLWILVTSGRLENNSILFWDEPENSLNPELVPLLVNILLELSRNGVQIFIATHSEILATYFNIDRKEQDSVMFYSLYKDNDEKIKPEKNCRFDLLTPNNLTAETVKIYERELEKRFGNG
jgi:predicted ATPase